MLILHAKRVFFSFKGMCSKRKLENRAESKKTTIFGCFTIFYFAFFAQNILLRINICYFFAP